MKKLTVEEIRNKQLEMLDYIDALCKKNNLKYFLAYGALLGAIRHKGYIPWDDDIDLWVFREDYDAFKQAIMKDNKYKFIDIYTSSTFRLDFAKVVDDTILLRESGAKEASSGLFIDIFPLDGFGNTKEEVLKNTKIISKQRKKFYFYNLSITSMGGSFLKKMIKLPVVLFHKFVLLFKNPRGLIQKYHETLRSLSNQYKNYVGYFDSPYHSYEEYIYKRECFKEAKGLFEGKEYSIPASYDELLTAFYGEYMKLPPEKARINHGIEAYLKD